MRKLLRRILKANPFGIPMPEGIDPTAFDRIPESLPRSDPAKAEVLLRKKAQQIFDFDRQRAESVGCVAYTWLTAGDADVCPTCAERNGKRFLYKKPPECGHAGVCTACPMGWCRCIAQPVIPD